MGNFVNIKDKTNLKDKSEFVFAKPSGCFIQFRTYTIPDRLIVSSPSQGVLIDTGMISTGNDFVTFNIAIPTDATITLDAPNQYTAWDLMFSDTHICRICSQPIFPIPNKLILAE
jgi:hypothetical protein